MDYEVVQQGNLFFTKGLAGFISAELEVELDDLTAKRAGEKAARAIFDLLINKSNEIRLRDGLLIEDFDLHPNKTLRKKGEISSFSKRKLYLVKKEHTFRIILSDVRGVWRG